MKLVVSFTIHLVSFKTQNLWLLSLGLTIKAKFVAHPPPVEGWAMKWDIFFFPISSIRYVQSPFFQAQSLPRVIAINIGGYYFETKLSTLTKDKDSMLAAMFSGRHELDTDSEGRYFIDRDGTYFKEILNYLRDSTQLPNADRALEVRTLQSSWAFRQGRYIFLKVSTDDSRFQFYKYFSGIIRA